MVAKETVLLGRDKSEVWSWSVIWILKDNLKSLIKEGGMAGTR